MSGANKRTDKASGTSTANNPNGNAFALSAPRRRGSSGSSSLRSCKLASHQSDSRGWMILDDLPNPSGRATPLDMVFSARLHCIQACASH